MHVLRCTRCCGSGELPLAQLCIVTFERYVRTLCSDRVERNGKLADRLPCYVRRMAPVRIAVLFATFGRFQIPIAVPAELTLVNGMPFRNELAHHFPCAIVHLPLDPIRISQELGSRSCLISRRDRSLRYGFRAYSSSRSSRLTRTLFPTDSFAAWSAGTSHSSI